MEGFSSEIEQLARRLNSCDFGREEFPAIDSILYDFHRNGQDSAVDSDTSCYFNQLSCSPASQMYHSNSSTSNSFDVESFFRWERKMDESGRSSSSRRKKRRGPNYCVFCKNNKEMPAFYRAHVLKDDDGRVMCPVLRIYKCPICGESGDGAHTVSYCPKRSRSEVAPLSAMIYHPPQWLLAPQKGRPIVKTRIR